MYHGLPWIWMIYQSVVIFHGIIIFEPDHVITGNDNVEPDDVITGNDNVEPDDVITGYIDVTIFLIMFQMLWN